MYPKNMILPMILWAWDLRDRNVVPKNEKGIGFLLSWV